MGKFARCLLAISLLFAAGTASLAQDNDTFVRSRLDAGYFIPYNGHCWWDTPEFRNGSLSYNGREYRDVPLNINANTGEVLVMRQREIIPLALESEMLAWAKIGESLFLNLHALGVGNAELGVYQLLKDGSVPVFYRVDKHLRGGSVDANGDIIGYKDPNYRADILNYFEKNASYYILRDGDLIHVKSKNAAKKLCDKAQRSELRKAVRATGMLRKEIGLGQYLSLVSEIIGVSSESPISLERAFAALPGSLENTEVIDNPSSVATKVDSISDSWFEPEDLGGVVRYVNGVPVVAIYRNKVYELGIRNKDRKGSVTIHGVVVDSEEGKPVVGAVVYEKSSADYTTTDDNGAWALDVPLGETVITFSEISMDDFPVMVNVFGRARLDVVMSPKSEMLNGVIVSADARAAHKTPKMGVEKLNLQAISRVPTAFGEGDVLKAVQALPGVQSVGEASAGINVRGGSSDQNLLLYNGSTVYNPTHMFGIFSAFDPNMIEDVELYKSSIPAEYGGRLSSVMNVRGKDGSFEKFKGALGIGVLTSHLMLESPIGKDKSTSVIVGGRTTYSNYLMDLLPANSSYAGGKASFSDVSARVTHRLKPGNFVRANLYWSDDSFGFSGDTTFRYSNLNASLQWDNQLSKKTKLHASAAYDSFRSNMQDAHDPYDAFSHTTGLNQFSVKSGLVSSFVSNHTLDTGIEMVFYTINPGKLDPLAVDSADITDSDPDKPVESRVVAATLDAEHGVQTSFWVSDTWQVLPRLTLDGGIRLSSFSNTGLNHSFSNPEMRISAKYSKGENFSVKAGYNTMAQYIHLISNSTSISPMDTWKLANNRIKPQTGWQGAAGVYLTAFGGMYDFSVETYYKRSYNGLDYKSGANLFMNRALESDLVNTTGKAYGLELMAKKSAGALNGWVAYTYSRSLLQETGDRGQNAINRGEWYKAPYDKPHSLQVVGNYEFTHRYSLSFNLDYSTGRPVTVPIGHYYYNGNYHLLYSGRNEYRIPDYFRLDLALNVLPGHRLTKLTHFSCTFGVYNVTGRKNAYSVYYTTSGNEVNGHMVSVFAVPIPYASVNMKF